jgi:antitoxin HigA-1
MPTKRAAAKRATTPRKTAKTSSKRDIAPVHPGEILREEFLDALEITPYRLAKSIGVDQTAISEILDGKRSVTAQMAFRLSRFFGTTPDFWVNLQKHYELEVAELEMGAKLEKIIPFGQAA